MRVFVTGATGFIGAAVVGELLRAGHGVTGLARSESAAAALADAGARVHRGGLNDLDSLRQGALAADGVIHLAFSHDFSDYTAAGEADLRAVETIGRALAGSGRPFVVTSGTLALTPGRIGTEDDPPGANSPATPRVASEIAAVSLAGRGVRASVIRLAPCVHDATRQGFATRLAAVARAKGVSAFVGDGSNRWPAVHRLDAARLFRLALESAPAGARLHGAGEEGVPFRAIAEAIAYRLGLPAVSITAGDARAHFGWLAPMVSTDNPTSSALTRGRLGWQPKGPTLVRDIEQGQAPNR